MIKQFPDPNQKFRWYQANTGDSSVSGNIWSSKNLDLVTNRGVMRLGGRMISGETTTTDSTITSVPISITSAFGDYYMIAGGRIFKTSGLDPDSAWSEDTGSGYKTNYDDEDSDLAVFDGQLWASNPDGWYSKTAASGSWTQITASPGSGITKYFKKLERLYIVQFDGVESVDDAGAFVNSGDYTIKLTSDNVFNVSSLEASTDSLWIAASNADNDLERASIFRWDGISPQAEEIYLMNSNKVYAMTVLNDVPYCFDNHGVLSKFTGSAFEEVGRVPMFNGSGANDFPVGSQQQTVAASMAMHFNGMSTTKNGTILCLFRNLREDANDTIPENSPSGIWEWSPEFGFVHRYGFTYTTRDTTTVTDWGQNRVGYVGAIWSADSAENAANRNGVILAGVELWTNATTKGLFGIYYDDYRNFAQKKGYFVTTWIDSEQIQDKWERIWSSYKKFTDSSDAIVLKYRTDEVASIEATITWVDTTSFTTTTDVSAYANGEMGNAAQGGEVEITRGIGSGLCAHITNISESGGTYTVTIDEVATGATTTTATARFQKWIKINPTQAQDTVQEFSQGAIGANSTSIQIKCCMTFTGTTKELQKLALVSNEDIKITQ